MRSLGTKLTTSGERKINIAATKPAASWIEEGGALTFGDATFDQIILDAYKIHVAIKVTEELLYDNAFQLESYIIRQFRLSRRKFYRWLEQPHGFVAYFRARKLILRTELERQKQIGYDLNSQLDPAGKNMTVGELVARYVSIKTGVRSTTKQGYNFVQKLLEQTDFSER